MSVAYLIGQKIADIRLATHKELKQMGIEPRPSGVPVIVLENGTIIHALMDEEGNGAGELCMLSEGKDYIMIGDEK